MRQRIITLATCLLVLGFMPATVKAQTASKPSTGLTIEPPFQEVVLTASQSSVTPTVRLTNESDQTVVFEVVATDIQQYDQEGRVVLDTKPVSGDSYSLAPYLSIPQSRLTIPPQQTATISAIITNSPDLPAGGHYAALIAKALPSLESTQQVLPGLSSFILVRKVGDERFSLSLKSHSLASRAILFSLPKELTVELANEGNTHLVPRGRAVIMGPGKTMVMSGILNEDSQLIFPATQRKMSMPLTVTGPRWPVMWYTATLVGSSQPSGASFGFETSFVYIHPGLIGLLLAASITGGVLIWKRRQQV